VPLRQQQAANAWRRPMRPPQPSRHLHRPPPPPPQDYREIRIQEPVQALAVGAVPRSIVVVLEDDLVDVLRAGDDVVVSGILLHRWGNLTVGQRCELEPVIRANHVEVPRSKGLGAAITQSECGGCECSAVSAGLRGASGALQPRSRNLTVDVRPCFVTAAALLSDFADFWAYFSGPGIRRPLAARDVIVKSACPQLHGLSYVKLVGTGSSRGWPRGTAGHWFSAE
jgi:hypothetical protein